MDQNKDKSVGVSYPSIECECCGGKTYVRVAAKRSWHLWRCVQCRLLFVWPQPDKGLLRQIYSMSSGYYKTAASDLSETSPDAAMELHGLLQEAGVRGGLLLDLGCSTGKLIFHLKKMGWSVAGCDVNEDAVRVARTNGLDVYSGSIEDIDCQEGQFDVIHMGDVLEHFLSPALALRRIHSLLSDKGVLVLLVPNSDCGFAISTLILSKITGLPWAHSEAPYHLFDFNERSIRELLGREGFETFSISFQGKSSFFYTVGGMGYFDMLKRKMKLSGHFKFSWQILPYLPVLLFISMVLLPFWAYGNIRDSIKKSGSSMMVIARRKA